MADIKLLVPEELIPKLNVTIVTDLLGLEKVQEFLNNNTVFAFDTETNFTDCFTTRKIRTIQLGNKTEQFVIDLLPFVQEAGITIEEAFRIPYSFHSCLQPIYDVVAPALENIKVQKIGHNLQFDYEVMKYCFGIRMCGMYCTFLTEKLIYAGQVRFDISGFWALDDLVLRYTGLQMSKDEQKGFDLTSPLIENQITYCALDCRLPFACKAGQALAIESGKLEKVVNIENSSIPAFGDMYLNGMGIDIKKWLRVVHKYKKLHKRHIAKLDEFFILIVGTKDYTDFHLPAMETLWRDEKDKEQRANYRKAFMKERKRLADLRDNYKKFPGQAAINYASPVALFNVMKTLPRFIEANERAAEASGKRERGVPWFRDTNDRTLKNFAEHGHWNSIKEALKHDPDYNEIGLIDALRLYRESEKLLNSYGTDWLRKNVNKVTGRVHGRLTQLGADTGRSSCKNPNMQQLPRGEEWRSCFVARPGYKLITTDYSGAELVILAELSQDPVFVHAYKNGWDIHSVVAELVFGDEWKNAAEENCAYYHNDHKKCKCEKHKELRTQAKPIGLGTAYGMEAGKLSETVGITFEEAEKILKKFRETFPVLIEYLTKSGDNAKELCESRSLSGRRRLFHKPSYKEATIKAKRRLEEKGIKDKNPSSRDVSWAQRAMYSAIEREGKNNPLQSSNADISKIAMGESEGMMWQFLEPEFNAKLVMFVHDEMVVECPDEFAGSSNEPGVCAIRIEEAMKSGAAELIKTVPMGCEGAVEPYWSK